MSTGKWAWALIPYPILPPSLTSRTVSVDVKHREKQNKTRKQKNKNGRKMFRELRSCVKSRGGCPGLPVPNSPHGLCGRKATLNLNVSCWSPRDVCAGRRCWALTQRVGQSFTSIVLNTWFSGHCLSGFGQSSGAV